MRSSSAIFSSLPVLETPRLILRPFGIEDVRDVFAYASDPLVSQYTTWNSPNVPEDSERLIEGLIERAKQNLPIPWGMVLKASGRIIGACGFDAWDTAHARAGFGYSLGRAHWGKGIATEAAEEVVRFGFQRLELYRLEAKCMVENTASERVMQKLGMTYEATLRSYWMKLGLERDVKVYSFLRREYMLRKAER